MPAIDFPAGFRHPSGLTFSLATNTQAFTSPLSRAAQTLELPGARWEVAATWGNLSAAEIRALRAWLLRLRGQAGRFHLWDMSHESPAGVASGSPVVSGAGQTGASLATSGWTPSTPGILRAGDLIGVGNELKMVTVDADSDAGGLATLAIEPPLRASPAAGAALVLTRPTAVFRLKDDGQDKFAIRPGLRADFTLEAVESWT